MQSQSLERVIAEHLAEWDSAYVELAIYGCDDAKAIAQTIDDFADERLAPQSQTRFFINRALVQWLGLCLWMAAASW